MNFEKTWWLEAEIDVFFSLDQPFDLLLIPLDRIISQDFRCQDMPILDYLGTAVGRLLVVVTVVFASTFHPQFQLSSNDFFCYHQIFSRENSSHGLMDLKKQAMKILGFQVKCRMEIHFS